MKTNKQKSEVGRQRAEGRSRKTEHSKGVRPSFSQERDGSFVVNGVVVCSPSKEFTRAQITLAASAPELLAALELAKHFIDNQFGTQRVPLQERVNAAIAKAKGE